MVHTHGTGERCKKCGSRDIDADEIKGKLLHYCLDCGHREET